MDLSVLAVALSAVFDAAVLWGLWRLVLRVACGRRGAERRRAAAWERDRRAFLLLRRDVLPEGVAAAAANA
ncbi:MAG: hypothetical protein IJ783_06005, partial [Kiritimatiellae bacterium]|nr:hypothetical protein [Kiritimatiellia bacterium]